MAKPAGTIHQLAEYLISGFWTYASEIPHHWGSNVITYNINALNASERNLAQTALNAWHEVANITFVLTTGTAQITFTHSGSMTAYEFDSYTASGTTTSATINISQDWVTTDGGAYDGKTGVDSYSYQTYLHEIGHALGLGHQGPYNGSANYAADAYYATDTWQYSLMSYNSQPNYDGSSYRYVITPQMADIYAVQALYGAATTRTGDTVYGFNNTAGSIYNFFSYSPAPALTIYDSGGSDTLDCSGYSANQTIDLHAGAFSSVGGLVHNIGIATNTVIERAIGGSGNDTLIASDAGCTLIGNGGADRLISGAGRDVITGGTGVDTFAFLTGASPASGQHDLITDFVSGTDKIDLSLYDVGFGTSAIDNFFFLGTTSFNGAAGALDYFYDSARSVTVLQGDTNGDTLADFAVDLSGNITLMSGDLTGIVFLTTVENHGSTVLTQIGIRYYLWDNTNSGPSLKFNGADYTAGQFGANVTPFGAEKTATGYEVAWKVTGSNVYSIWSTDNNGNYLTNFVNGAPGTNSDLEAQETIFQQDLNGDGTIGVVSGGGGTAIESSGVTSLTQVGANFYLWDGTSSGPSLKFNDALYTADQFGANVSPIGAEKTASGYEIAWKVAGSNLYSIWSTDNNGNYLTNLVNGVTAGDASLQSHEATFQQDLNGDGTIGPASGGGGGGGTAIESSGVTSLTQVGSNFYLWDGTSSGPSLKFNGAAYTAGQFGANVSPIGAEKTASGYEVAWKVAGSNLYSIWSTDDNGNYLANLVNGVTASDASLQSHETTFQQDLNGDGTIGAVSGGGGTAVESSGVTSLTQVGTSFYLWDSNSSGPSLKFNGADYGAGQFGANVSPIGAEKSVSGYEVAWKVTGSDIYSIWSTDNNGNYLTNLVNGASGTNSVLESHETTFQQDLNGDGVIGINNSPISVASVQDDTFIFNCDSNTTASSSFANETLANASDIVTNAADEVCTAIADAATILSIDPDLLHQHPGETSII